MVIVGERFEKRMQHWSVRPSGSEQACFDGQRYVRGKTGGRNGMGKRAGVRSSPASVNRTFGLEFEAISIFDLHWQKML